jgi:hypothetical protein
MVERRGREKEERRWTKSCDEKRERRESERGEKEEKEEKEAKEWN